MSATLPSFTSGLFSHLTADKADLYRAILDTFAAAKRQFRLHLRPDLAAGLGELPRIANEEGVTPGILDRQRLAIDALRVSLKEIRNGLARTSPIRLPEP